LRQSHFFAENELCFSREICVYEEMGLIMKKGTIFTFSFICFLIGIIAGFFIAPAKQGIVIQNECNVNKKR
jgi:hypothetical protein